MTYKAQWALVVALVKYENRDTKLIVNTEQIGQMLLTQSI